MPDLTVPAHTSFVPAQSSPSPLPHPDATDGLTPTATEPSRSAEQQAAAVKAAIQWRKKLTSERESVAQQKLLTSLKEVVKPQAGDNGEPKSPSVPDSERLTALYRGDLLSRHQFIAGLKIWASFDKGLKGREGLEALLNEQRIRYRDYPDERESILADLTRFDDNLDLPPERKNAAAVCRAILQQPDAGMLGLYRFSTEPVERERFLAFFQSVIDDETIAQQDRESIRIERDSITRLHELIPAMAKVTSHPGEDGDAALNALLDRYEAEYKAVPNPVDREYMLAELRYFAEDNSLSESRRATILARRAALQGNTSRILEAYCTAADPLERRLYREALRSLLASNKLSRTERIYVVDEMHRINAARLLAIFNPDKPFEATTTRYTALRDAMTEAMESYFYETAFVFGKKVRVFGSTTTWSFLAPTGVSLVTAGLAAYKAPSLKALEVFIGTSWLSRPIAERSACCP